MGQSSWFDTEHNFGIAKVAAYADTSTMKPTYQENRSPDPAVPDPGASQYVGTHSPPPPYPATPPRRTRATTASERSSPPRRSAR